MVLEATIIVLDNSAWARNGDFLPTRWDAQIDALHVVATSKRQMNPENTVGLMTMGGDQVQVLVTPTPEEGRILAGLHGIKLKGKIELSNALQIAQLALKHRMNKNLRQRIVAFVASPIEHEELNNLVSVAKKLRKNNVALDVINIGEYHQNHVEKLEKLIENVNNENNSHFLNVDASQGQQVLSEIVMASPILVGEGGPGAGGGAGGLDLAEDPELAMAIRMSLEEEERKKKAEEERKRQQEQQQQQQQPAQQPAPASNQAGYQPLQTEDQGKAAPQKTPEEPKPVKAGTNEMDIEDMSEEELLKRAKELSMQNPDQKIEEEPKKPPAPQEGIFEDEKFIEELLESNEINRDDPEIQKLLAEMKKKKGEGKKDEGKK